MNKPGVLHRRTGETEFAQVFQTGQRRQISIRNFLPRQVQVHDRYSTFQQGKQRRICLFDTTKIDVVPVRTDGERLHQDTTLSELRKSFLLGFLNLRAQIRVFGTHAGA